MGVIYKIICLTNKEIYIGSTIDLYTRKSVHFHHLRKNTHHSPILQNAFNKYGESDFVMEIIEEVSDNTNLTNREQYWMDALKPKFNCSPTAQSPLGVKHTEQAKKNMSEAHKGIKPTKEAIIKRSAKQSGKNHWTYSKSRSDETKSKIRKSLAEYYKTHKGSRSGSTVSSSTKEKIKNKLYIPIIQYDLNGNIIKEWMSSKIATTELKLHNTSLIDCLKGRRKSYKGFIWKYKNDK